MNKISEAKIRKRFFRVPVEHPVSFAVPVGFSEENRVTEADSVYHGFFFVPLAELNLNLVGTAVEGIILSLVKVATIIKSSSSAEVLASSKAATAAR